jgi:hypothetical protein
MLDKDQKEISLHTQWVNWTKKHSIYDDAFGAAGPDLVLNIGGGVVECKARDGIGPRKAAIRQTIARQVVPPYLVVATPGKAFLYIKPNPFTDATKPDFAFQWPEQGSLLLNCIRSKNYKAALDPHFELLFATAVKQGIPPVIAILTLLTAGQKNAFVVLSNRIVFFPKERAKEIAFDAEGSTQEWAESIHRRFFVADDKALKARLIHEYSSLLPDEQKSSLGKYYTPAKLTELVRKEAEPYLKTPNIEVADLAAGCGAFLKAFEDQFIRGFDVDHDAVAILRALEFENITQKNSLEKKGRDWFGIPKNAPLIVVGNPPYNDPQSKNKRYGTNRKIPISASIAEDLKTGDIGRSFLKQIFSLNPVRAIILHPFAYLCKSRNFKELCGYRFRLKVAHVFPSSEFLDTSATVFPCACSVWEPTEEESDFESEWGRIQRMFFPLLDSERKFCLSLYRTFGNDELQKYAKKGVSDIGVYHYNFRDLNSLITSANFMTRKDENNFPVNWDKFPLYAFVNVVKRRWGQVPVPDLDLIAGNLSIPKLNNLLEQPLLCMCDTTWSSNSLSDAKELAIRLRPLIVREARTGVEWAVMHLNGEHERARAIVGQKVIDLMHLDKETLLQDCTQDGKIKNICQRNDPGTCLPQDIAA